MPANIQFAYSFYFDGKLLEIVISKGYFYCFLQGLHSIEVSLLLIFFDSSYAYYLEIF